MKRRTLVQGAVASALGLPHLAGFAQQSVTLKFHTFMAPMSNVWLSMHKPWMDKVEKESGKHIKFEAYPAMQLGGTPVQLYDRRVTAWSTWSGRCPATPPAGFRASRSSSCRS
jgi:TRAP-type C4-dicarboxylate transport system substrate-binding protein